jgi:hypothetical protein
MSIFRQKFKPRTNLFLNNANYSNDAFFKGLMLWTLCLTKTNKELYDEYIIFHICCQVNGQEQAISLANMFSAVALQITYLRKE